MLSTRHAERLADRIASPNARVAAGLAPPSPARPQPAGAAGQASPVCVAVVPIIGVMSKYGTWADDFLGPVPATDVAAQIADALADPSVVSIALLIGCPGGTTSGSFELADAVAAGNQVKPVTAIVSDLCGSAAFLVASQCRTIAANPTAMIGSIGVFTVLTGTTQALADRGVRLTLVTSGGTKGAGRDGSVTDALTAQVQAEVDALHQQFVARAAAAGRRMPVGAAQQLADGRMLMAADAKSAGLIDAIGSLPANVQAVLASAAGGPGGDLDARAGRRQGEQFVADQLRAGGL